MINLTSIEICNTFAIFPILKVMVGREIRLNNNVLRVHVLCCYSKCYCFCLNDNGNRKTITSYAPSATIKW